MTTNRNPQLAPATALVQLVREYPDLPDTVWTISGGTLHGHVYGPLANDMEAIRLFVEVLGGSVRPRHDFEYGGRTLRVHELAALWRDVSVVVQVSVPLSVAVAS